MKHLRSISVSSLVLVAPAALSVAAADPIVTVVMRELDDPRGAAFGREAPCVRSRFREDA